LTENVHYSVTVLSSRNPCSEYESCGTMQYTKDKVWIAWISFFMSLWIFYLFECRTALHHTRTHARNGLFLAIRCTCIRGPILNAPLMVPDSPSDPLRAAIRQWQLKLITIKHRVPLSTRLLRPLWLPAPRFPHVVVRPIRFNRRIQTSMGLVGIRTLVVEGCSTCRRGCLDYLCCFNREC